METKALGLENCEIKYLATEGVFSGYGSVFGVEDAHKDIVMPGAFDNVIKSGNTVMLYVNHGWMRGDLPVGKWQGLAQDKFGLFGESKMAMQMPSAQNAYFALKNDLVTGLSMGYSLDKKHVEPRQGGGRVIHKVNVLKEISIVTNPSNKFASVTNVKTAETMAEIQEIKTISDFEGYLRDAGGLSKGFATALVSRFRDIVKQGEPDAGDAEIKAYAAIARRLDGLVKS